MLEKAKYRTSFCDALEEQLHSNLCAVQVENQSQPSVSVRM
jgi:hypothetical protein